MRKLDLGDMGVAPRSLYWKERRIDISINGTGSVFNLYVAIVDDGGLYILRFDEDSTSGRSSCSSRHAAKYWRRKPHDRLNDLARSAHAYQ